MLESFEVSDIIPASPKQVYDAWLNGDQHAAMTGGDATGSPKKGAKFTAWDGYIAGKNLELEPHRRIVQSWRTSEFEAKHPDSRLEVLLKAVPGGTEVTLKHSEIPDGRGASYKSGWNEHYFEPMKAHFSG